MIHTNNNKKIDFKIVRNEEEEYILTENCLVKLEFYGGTVNGYKTLEEMAYNIELEYRESNYIKSLKAS